jgi:hypothetical protein
MRTPNLIVFHVTLMFLAHLQGIHLCHVKRRRAETQVVGDSAASIESGSRVFGRGMEWIGASETTERPWRRRTLQPRAS